MVDVDAILSRYDRVLGRLGALESEYSKAQTEVKRLKSREANIREAQQVLQLVAQQTQQALEFQLSDLATVALRSVFPDPYSVVVRFEPKRGRSEARISFKRGKHEMDPLSASGGGPVDVVSFAFRVSLLSMNKDRIQPTLFLDEPFRFVSEEYRGLVSEMLTTVARRLKMQFIVVSHSEEIADAADCLIRVRMDADGRSVVQS